MVDLVGHKGGVTTAFFDARDEQVRVLSGGDDGTARVWDAATGKLEATLQAAERVTDVSFVGEANVLTASDDGALTIWD
ncbi:hypothetical protein, partial [Pseudomonas sp. MPR-R2A5]|uniref:hypothetical protein n=1 Tax=Pseudomonas sp. MPR-R2A5 TaxID=2070622 RepID=UPI0011AFA4B8